MVGWGQTVWSQTLPSYRHDDVQWGDGWFDVDCRGVFSEEMGGRSCVTDGVVSLLSFMLYCDVRAVGVVSTMGV